MIKTYKFRLYPSNAQKVLLENTIEQCRIVYNNILAYRKDMWENEHKSLTAFDTIKLLPEMKEEIPTLRQVYSQILQNVCQRVNFAYQGFFRRVKAKDGKAGFPRFKGKYRYDSFTYPQSGFEINKSKLHLSKIGNITIKQHRPIEGIIKTCTIRRTATGKWFACFSCILEDKEPVKDMLPAIGIDMGLERFATLSNVEKIENPHFFKADQKVIAKAQRKLSKCEKGTKERAKARRALAHAYEKVVNRRNNFCHQESRKIVNQFNTIVFEDLSINEMLSDGYRATNRAIGDVAWGQFLNFLTYKAEGANKYAIKVNPAYTSQTCSNCGNRHKIELSDRNYHCPSCGFEMDRDLNASINILGLGIQSLANSLDAP